MHAQGAVPGARRKVETEAETQGDRWSELLWPCQDFSGFETEAKMNPGLAARARLILAPETPTRLTVTKVIIKTVSPMMTYNDNGTNDDVRRQW